MPNTWIIAVDGSDPSFRALENISKLHQTGDYLVLLMVVKGIRFDLTDYNERKEKQDKECAKTLERYKKFCTTHDMKFLAEITAGDPREIILDCARRHKANYIAMGSRGLAGLKSLLMGSVSSYVVEQSHIPVLVVK